MAHIATGAGLHRLLEESLQPVIRAIGLSLGPDGRTVLYGRGPRDVAAAATGFAIAREMPIPSGPRGTAPRLLKETLLPTLGIGHRLRLGPLTAIVEEILGHPRLISLRFEADSAELWRGLATHGRPVQYAHMKEPLRLWDVWTPIAGPPVAYEPPSAGFSLDWQLLDDFAAAGIEFATLTHAAGISSTGDAELDRRLPFDEPYFIAESTAQAIARACHEDRRVIAIGTTVVRALEHSAARFGIVMPGNGVATQRIGASTSLRVVDAILSGTHEPGASHYELLQAFAATDALRRADRVLDAAGFRTHEFGDSVLIERDSRQYSRALRSCDAFERFAEMQGLAGSAPPRILRAFSRAPLHVVQESHRLSPADRLVGQRG